MERLFKIAHHPNIFICPRRTRSLRKIADIVMESITLKTLPEGKMSLRPRVKRRNLACCGVSRHHQLCVGRSPPRGLSVGTHSLFRE
jgi:hypothetical protein